MLLDCLKNHSNRRESGQSYNSESGVATAGERFSRFQTPGSCVVFFYSFFVMQVYAASVMTSIPIA